MKDEKRLNELFSLAYTTNKYGSLGRHLPEGDRPVRERDVSFLVPNLKEKDVEREVSLDRFNYSYGL